MKWFNRLFMQTPSEPVELTVSRLPDRNRWSTLSKIDQLCIDLFKEHYRFMLRAKAIDVVESVWGYKNNGTLSQEQHRISQRVEPIVNEFCSTLKPLAPSREHSFTLKSILYNFIIYKLLYMVEHKRNSDLTRTELSMN